MSDKYELTYSVAHGDDDAWEVVLSSIEEEPIATFVSGTRATTDEVAAWAAEQMIKAEAAACGYGTPEVLRKLRHAARLLSAEADRMEGDWG